MADSCEDIDISFCTNLSSDYEVGKLKLCSLEEYGKVLPPKIYFELPCGKIWKCYFRRGTDCIEGLEEMMKYYGIKPYHMLIFHYTGGPNFHVEIFNECAVEISYPFESFENHTKVQTRRNSGLVQNIGLDCSAIEVQKLRATLTYNAKVNFVALYEYEISKVDLKSDYRYQVLSWEACRKMDLNAQINSVRLRLHGYMLTIKLKWSKGTLYFDNNWYKFLSDAKIGIGDVCVFHRTKLPATYEISVLCKRLIDMYGIAEEYFKAIPEDVMHGWKWFKNIRHLQLSNSTKMLTTKKLKHQKY